MREIKFRAWDKEKKLLNTVVLIDFTDHQVNCGFEWLKYDKYALMQFTGLQDKNGREIYEGDIVEKDTEGLWVVKFENAEFGLYQKFRHSFSLWNLLDTIVVFGNIYENPELLKGV